MFLFFLCFLLIQIISLTQLPIELYSLESVIEASCLDIEVISNEEKQKIETLNGITVSDISVELTGKTMIEILPKIKEETILNFIPLKKGDIFSFSKLFEVCKKIRSRFHKENYRIELINEKNLHFKLSLNNPSLPIIISPRIFNVKLPGLSSSSLMTTYKVTLVSSNMTLGQLTMFNIETAITQLHELGNKSLYDFNINFNHPINDTWSLITGFNKHVTILQSLKYLPIISDFESVQYVLKDEYLILLSAIYQTNYAHQFTFGTELALSYIQTYSLDQNDLFEASFYIDRYKYFNLKSENDIFYPYLFFNYQYSSYYFSEKPIFYHTRFTINTILKFSPGDLLHIPKGSLILKFLFTNISHIGVKDFSIENYLEMITETIPESHKNFNLKISGFPQGVVFGKNFYHYTLLFKYIFYNSYTEETLTKGDIRISVGLFSLIEIGNAWNSPYYFDGMFDNIFFSNTSGIYVTIGHLIIKAGVSFPIYPTYRKAVALYMKFSGDTIAPNFKLLDLYDDKIN